MALYSSISYFLLPTSPYNLQCQHPVAQKSQALVCTLSHLDSTLLPRQLMNSTASEEPPQPPTAKQNDPSTAVDLSIIHLHSSMS